MTSTELFKNMIWLPDLSFTMIKLPCLIISINIWCNQPWILWEDLRQLKSHSTGRPHLSSSLPLSRWTSIYQRWTILSMRTNKFLHSKVWRLDSIKASMIITTSKEDTCHMVRSDQCLSQAAWEMYLSQRWKKYQHLRVTSNSRHRRILHSNQPLITAGTRTKTHPSSSMVSHSHRWTDLITCHTS